MNGILNFGSYIIEVTFDAESGEYTFIFSGGSLDEPVTVTGTLGE